MILKPTLFLDGAIQLEKIMKAEPKEQRRYGAGSAKLGDGGVRVMSMLII